MVRSIFIEEDVDKIIELKVPQHGEDEMFGFLRLLVNFLLVHFSHPEFILFQ